MGAVGRAVRKRSASLAAREQARRGSEFHAGAGGLEGECVAVAYENIISGSSFSMADAIALHVQQQLKLDPSRSSVADSVNQLHQTLDRLFRSLAAALTEEQRNSAGHLLHRQLVNLLTECDPLTADRLKANLNRHLSLLLQPTPQAVSKPVSDAGKSMTASGISSYRSPVLDSSTGINVPVAHTLLSGSDASSAAYVPALTSSPATSSAVHFPFTDPNAISSTSTMFSIMNMRNNKSSNSADSKLAAEDITSQLAVGPAAALASLTAMLHLVHLEIEEAIEPKRERLYQWHGFISAALQRHPDFEREMVLVESAAAVIGKIAPTLGDQFVSFQVPSCIENMQSL